MWIFVKQIAIAGVVVLLLVVPETRAMDDVERAMRDCRSAKDSQQALAACTTLIERYGHQFNRLNLGRIYLNRGLVREDLGQKLALANDDYERACDLGEGLGCCVRAANYLDDWSYGDGGKDSYAKAQKLLTRAEKLGADEEECKAFFDPDLLMF